MLVDVVTVAIAFALAFPIGWERGRGRYSVGFRTLPIGVGSCLRVRAPGGHEFPRGRGSFRHASQQGVITGIGFIGGGAIVKQRAM
ncbi:hypothetical protein F2981_32420 (plasmid) [Sinorhizobium meliloti]|nr:hypothetical protein [Sinorhizobium meliloti]